MLAACLQLLPQMTLAARRPPVEPGWSPALQIAV
jgi:hypothetical protein